MSAEERNELLDLIHEVSLERRRVVLASGQVSDFYLDLRQTLMCPVGVRLAGKLVLERLGQVECRWWYGCGRRAFGECGARRRWISLPILFAPWFFCAQGSEETRPGPPNWKVGSKKVSCVVLVEDTTTTGGSTIEALEIVRAAGGVVDKVICLVDRGEGAFEAFAQKNVVLDPLFGRADLRV